MLAKNCIGVLFCLLFGVDWFYINTTSSFLCGNYCKGALFFLLPKNQQQFIQAA